VAEAEAAVQEEEEEEEGLLCMALGDDEQPNKVRRITEPK
jgi:hypothetical protein